MTLRRRLEVCGTALASAGAFAGTCTAAAGPHAAAWRECLLPAGLALLCGWGFLYNLLMMFTGREEAAVLVGYPDEVGPYREMSPIPTTALMLVFWLNGLAVVGATISK